MITIQHNVSLKPYNTFGIDALAKQFVSVHSVHELLEVLEQFPNEKKLFLSGGSNMLITTSSIDGLVVKLDLKGHEIIEETTDFVYIEVQGGEEMHPFVLWSIAQGYGGLENLSLIPGNIGTAPIQNVGAYGVEIKDVLASCKALNIHTLQTEVFTNADCQFAYRDSFFKNEGKGVYIVLSVVVKLKKQNHVLHLDYGDIRKEFEVQGITQPTIKDVSNAVIAIRSSKLPNPKEIGNSGSFFKNPVIDKASFETFNRKFPEAPYFAVGDHAYKVPAGWLIEKAGYKGFRRGDAGVHKKQALVLVNYGNAKGEELIALAKEIQQKVLNDFGIEITPEVNIIA